MLLSVTYIIRVVYGFKRITDSPPSTVCGKSGALQYLENTKEQNRPQQNEMK
jgi:hypothetical protein